MPNLNKKRRAAMQREATKKLARQSAEAILYPPFNSVHLPPADGVPPDVIDDSVPIPLEPLIVVKQELPEVEANPLEHLLEVKVEPLDPADKEPEPSKENHAEETDQSEKVHQKPSDLPPLDPHRCQFCLKLFSEVGGRGLIARKRVVFVLGDRRWESLRDYPNCCQGCSQLFKLFYQFKRSCLVALTRPELLMASQGENVSRHEVVDLQPVVGRENESERSGDVVEVVEPDSHPQNMEQSIDELEIEPEVDSQNKPNKRSLVSQSPNNDSDDHNEQNPAEEHSEREREELKTETPTGEIPSNQSNPKQQQHTNPKYCFRCKEYYESEAIYWEHRPTCTRPPRDPPPLACPQCPKRFNRQDQLTYHVNQHNGLRTVPCRREGCTKMFFHPDLRHRHEESCGKDPQNMCTMCAAVFRSKGALYAHMATHGDPTYICEVCNKGFYTKANLQKHAPIHSGARNFECKVCGKRFKSYEANRVHQRIHTQEKPYSCPKCGMAFMYNCILKTHLQKNLCVGPSPVDWERRELLDATSSIERA